jgi:hypothetical protein
VSAAGAKVTGKAPAPSTVLSVLDIEGQKSMRSVRVYVVPVVRTMAPKLSGDLAGGINGRVTKQKDGYRLQIRPSRGQGKKMRWVTRGTGVYREGPGPKAPITPKRPGGELTLPGGRKYASVKGQKPNDFMARADRQTRRRAEILIRQGATNAVKVLSRGGR